MVVSIVPDGPADKNFGGMSIEPKDRILSVDGRDVENHNVLEVQRAPQTTNRILLVDAPFNRLALGGDRAIADGSGACSQHLTHEAACPLFTLGGRAQRGRVEFSALLGVNSSAHVEPCRPCLLRRLLLLRVADAAREGPAGLSCHCQAG